MKRDIRTLFKEDELDKKLPENHRQEFFEKLSKSSVKPKKNYPILKIVASVLILISVGFYAMKSVTKSEENNIILAEMQQVEKEYLKNIDQEWQQFIALTNDQKLIKKYEEKLNKLAQEYQQLSTSFKKQPNNIEILEELISNLQQRLSTLKEIKEHLKTLKETPKTYEKIVI